VRRAPFLALAVIALCACSGGSEEDLPVLVPEGIAIDARIRNRIPIKDLHRTIRGPAEDGSGLAVDLGDESLEGWVYAGPYPFEEGEADYDYARYRLRTPIRKGRGTIPVLPFLSEKINSNNWPEGQSGLPATPAVAYRYELWRRGADGIESLGFLGGVVNVRFEGKSVRPNLTILEGPFVTGLSSDAPDRATIFWRTDREAEGEVVVTSDGVSRNWKRTGAGGRHAVTLDGLEPGKFHLYRVTSRTKDGEEVRSSGYLFRTAPEKGKGEVVFAFASDSREGVGGGERRYMGVNRHVLARVANDAFKRGAELAIFGGDLVNGYTSDVDDFRLQLRAFKDTWSGFWRSRPVYPAMGNHETLLRTFLIGVEKSVSLDRWPYATESAEAVFADEFENPANGPEPSDPRRPTYRENVYSFHWGPVRFIAFNNDYWWTADRHVPNYGGCPQGVMLDDQLSWIEARLAGATKDDAVRFVILYAQEPVFPGAGHVADAMWWNGDNRVRAFARNGEKVEPVSAGVIDVRNRFWKAVAGCKKTAAVLVGDEHAYLRTRIDATTPVGVPAKDDTNGDGVLDSQSPNPEFRYPTWQSTAGNAGAPHYSRQPTPWKVQKVSSQPGYCLFETDGKKISLSAYATTGQRIDHVEDLMAIKGE
jgi:hypothetical protein